MIFDNIKNSQFYPLGTAWKSIFDFINALSADSEEKKYMIQDDDIFAQVMSYNTKTTQDAILESHRKYADIQLVLKGRERIEWFYRDKLEIDVPYDESKDAEFYKYQSPATAHIDLNPGTFVLFFPHDAHMPSLMVGLKSEWVKKVVVKIKLELLLNNL